MQKGVKKGVIIGSSTIVGLLLLCIIAISSVLEYFTSKKGIEKITKIAEEYIVGDVSLGEIDYTFWNSIPRIGITLEEVMLKNEGDTIARVQNAYAELNWWKFITQKAIYINEFSIKEADANIHLYADSTLNFVVKTDSTSEGSSTPPLIILRKGRIEDINIHYTDDLHKMEASVDSLDIRITDLVKNPKKENNVYVATPKARFRNESFAIDSIPIAIEACIVASPRDRIFNIHELSAKILSLDVEGNGSVRIDEKIETDLHWRVEIDNLAEIKNVQVEPVQEKIQHIYFDGRLLAEGDFDGIIGEDVMPSVVAKVEVDSGKMAFEGLPHQIDMFVLKASVDLDLDSLVNSFVELKELNARSGKSFMTAEGRIDDVFGKCKVDADVDCYMDLNYLRETFPQKYFTEASGKISSCIQGRFTIDDIMNHRLEKVYSKAELHVERVKLQAPIWNLEVFADSLNWTLGTNSVAHKRTGKISLMASRLAFDQLSLKYGDLIKRCKASRFAFNCTADRIENGVPQMRAALSARSMDGWIDTVRVFSKKTRASIALAENPNDSLTPKADVRLTADSLLIENTLGGVRLDSSTIQVSVVPRIRTHYRHSRKKSEEENLRDSLAWVEAQKKRVSVTLDSLYKQVEGIAKESDPATTYLRQFRTTGNVIMKEGFVNSEYFPLEVKAYRGNLAFNDDTLKLHNFQMQVGKTRMKLTGDMRNMRRAFLRGKTLEGRFNLESPLVDLNEIFHASREWEKGIEAVRETKAKQTPTNTKGDSIHNNDVAKLEEESDTTSLMVVPKILDLEFHADIDKLLFTDITLNDFNGDVTIKEQVVKIKNLATTTSLGEARMDVIYECKSDSMATAGVDLTTDNVDVHELIRHIPTLDSIVPMLRSFEGQLDCEVTATTQLNEKGEVVLPTVNAAAKLHGENMVLLDGETFTTIAKSLMFKNKKRNLIDSLSIEFTVKENKMEVLPFMLCMDKYKVAVSGNHNFDMSFNYHISVLRPVVLGLNVFGNLDDIKYKLVERKYKNEKSVVSSCEIDGVNIRKRAQERLREAIK